MKKIQIDTEYIKLDSLLKLSGLVQSGGEAKMLIQSGEVLLNGETCLERGRKVRGGDVVRVSDDEITVTEK